MNAADRLYLRRSLTNKLAMLLAGAAAIFGLPQLAVHSVLLISIALFLYSKH